jgi:hypothetical protein
MLMLGPGLGACYAAAEDSSPFGIDIDNDNKSISIVKYYSLFIFQ